MLYFDCAEKLICLLITLRISNYFLIMYSPIDRPIVKRKKTCMFYYFVK